MRSLFFCITLFIFTHPCYHAKAQVIRYDHDANQLEGFTDISLKEGTLTFESGSSRGGFIVIESDAPIILISTHNVVVELSPE
jgi:hypothetical protein